MNKKVLAISLAVVRRQMGGVMPLNVTLRAAGIGGVR